MTTTRKITTVKQITSFYGYVRCQSFKRQPGEFFSVRNFFAMSMHESRVNDNNYGIDTYIIHIHIEVIELNNNNNKIVRECLACIRFGTHSLILLMIT